MPLPLNRSILPILFKIHGYCITELEDQQNRIVFVIEPTRKPVCPHCGRMCGGYDSNMRTILIGTVLCIPVYARVLVRRVNCPNCGVVTEETGFVDGKRSYSKPVADTLVRYTKVLSNKATASLWGLSSPTVLRLDREMLEELVSDYRRKLPRISRVSVDEVSCKPGHSYLTVVSNQDDGKVIWVEPGRKQADCEKALRVLKGHPVKAVCMDFWKPYEQSVRKAFPNAAVIPDKFHLARLLNKAVDAERRRYQRTLGRDERYRIKKTTHWVLLRRQVNLTESQRMTLDQLKTVNNPLYELYLLKEAFLDIFSPHLDKACAAVAIANWTQQVFGTGFRYLAKFAEGVIRKFSLLMDWFDHRISNGKAEGINNVIKTLLKRAYGYKDMDYLRLKILQVQGYLCF